MKRKELTIKQKLEIVQDFIKTHPKPSHRDLAKKYRIGKTSIKRILDNKDALLSVNKNDFNVRKRCRLQGLYFFKFLM